MSAKSVVSRSILFLAILFLSTACPKKENPPPGEVPAAPANLTATGGDAQIALAWDLGPDATSYAIYRATVSGANYSKVGTSTEASWVNTGLSNGTAYYFVVRAANSVGESGNSNEAIATPHQTLLPPEAPANLLAVAGEGQVSLTWDAVADIGTYRVYRGTATGGPYDLVSMSGETNFPDFNVVNGTTYYYVVVARNDAGESPYSNEASATPEVATVVPPAPTELVAVAGDAEVSLSWQPAATASTYKVYRSETQGSGYELIGEPSILNYDDQSDLINGTTYYYVVAAVNSVGDSPYSNEASATPTASTGILAPGNLRVTSELNGSVGLAWDAVSGVTGYTVWRSTTQGGGTYGIYNPVGFGVTATVYSDATVTNGTTYYYVVTAMNASFESSPNSNEVSATPHALARHICVADNIGSSAQTSGGIVLTLDGSLSGNHAPLNKFGWVTGLNQPLGVAVDATHNEIFVANNDAFGDLNYPGSSITVYDTGDTGATAPKRVIFGVNTGISEPNAVAVDETHNEIFVTVDHNILVFSRTADGDVVPLRTITGDAAGIETPTGIAVDPVQNELYVLQVTVVVVSDPFSITFMGTIAVFSRTADGDVAPLRSITWPLVNTQATPNALALDRTNHELVVASSSGHEELAHDSSILVFNTTDSGEAAPKRTITGLKNWVSGVAVDPAHNEILAASVGALTGEIQVYNRTDTGAATPLRIFEPIANGMNGPFKLTYDSAHDEMVVTDMNIDELFTFPRTATGTTAPSTEIGGKPTGLEFTSGIAYDSVNDRIIALNSGNDRYLELPSITVYPANAGDGATPLQTISGLAARLDLPQALAFDGAHGEIFVADNGCVLQNCTPIIAPQILTYSADADGNVAPVRVIEGLGASGLVLVFALAYDSATDELFVANQDDNGYSIRVFNRTDSGDVAPKRVITGANTQLSNWGALSLAVDPGHGELFAATGGNTLLTFSHTADGDVAPTRTLSNGGGLDFMGAKGLAHDPVTDEIYLASTGSDEVYAVARTATSNSVAYRVIGGQTTWLSRPWGITLCE